MESQIGCLKTLVSCCSFCNFFLDKDTLIFLMSHPKEDRSVKKPQV
jgi:hypothetical protein